ncbi:Kanadaptin [Sesamum alatum]|uniref:Kanadaptin n=1 Tax=Sesamum alatum TaxID=300844 RepID=A0AAE1XT15_9LAMI|nr:Kanadaptin [Sesamum alatum]
MGPPPPKDPTGEPSTSTSETTKATAMAPPPPRNPKSSEPGHEPDSSENIQNEPELNPPHTDTSENSNRLPDSTNSSTNGTSADAEKKQEQRSNNAAVPYTIPPWSAAPGHQFVLEVLKDGAIVDQFDVNKKGAYMFGRVDLCDFVLEHPTISRFHAVLQFKSNGGAYLYDLGSTHGTFINKNQVKKRVYVDLHVGDVIRFGHSSRLYIFQGPSDLMPPEADLKSLRKAKMRQEMEDMEASLLRAKLDASRADGISWGMREDAVEDTEDEVDEITWQTYKGQLTEKQEKTRDKVIKRLEKIAHMKKEIDAIRAKDIAQGGLTQGQQTQIARNEQRISQIMEELENLEETLNESIRESIGARAGKLSRGKKKGTVEEEEEDYFSDEDEFYDRTQKSSKHKSGENQSIETADSLLDKKDALVKQIEDKEKLLLNEDEPTETNEVPETGDALDAYMSTVSSQLVLDNKEKLRKELSTLQSELDRILYLLRIADPTGEAAKKRESKEQKPKAIVKKNPASDAGERPKREKNTVAPMLEKGKNFGQEVKSIQEKASVEVKSESDVKREEPKSVADESTATEYTVPKPQWLGAVGNTKKQEITQELPAEQDQDQEQDQFVDYKDRGKIVNKTDSSLGDQGIEAAAPGLIIRKRKEVEKSKVSEAQDAEQTVGSEFKAEDAIALLLKHSRGYHASDEEDRPVSEEVLLENQGRKDAKKPKRVLGPDRPSFLNEPDYSSWVPPEGQSGDGRTSLNDRFGY